MNISNIKKKVLNIFKSGESLSQKVARGGVLIMVSFFTNRLFMLIRTIILARLLMPSDFGLVGIAMVCIGTLDVFSRTGFDAALVQKKEEIKDSLDTAWIISVLRGFVLFLILFFSAPLIAGFFNNNRIIPILMVVAFSRIFDGFTNIGIVYFSKELEIRKNFLLRLGETIADVSVAISLVFILRNVWAIVYGFLAGQLTRLVLSYLIHPYRPKLNFDWQKAKELFNFGKHLLTAGIIIFLLSQGDHAFVGKVVGVTALGFYSLAYRLSSIPATHITQVLFPVTFPAYSKLQDNRAVLKEAYFRVLRLIGFLSVPVTGGMFVLAPELVRVFIGEKWMPMVPAFKVLCLFGLIRAIGATTGPLFWSIKRPDIAARISGIQLIILAIIIYPLSIRWGILGTSVAIVIAASVNQIIAVREILKIIRCTLFEFTRFLIYPAVGAVGMVIFILVAKNYLLEHIGLVVLLLVICSSAALYFGIMYLIDRKSKYHLGKTIIWVFRSI